MGQSLMALTMSNDAVVLEWLTRNANTHNDFLVFLVEYGVIGAGLLATSVVLVARRYLRWRFPGWLRVDELAILGVFGHALIDNPLRSGAVLGVIAMMTIPFRPRGG